MAEQLSLGAMATRLLIDGALPTIEDETVTRPEVFPGRELTLEERDKLSLPNQGPAFAYPDGAGGALFAHLLRSDANIWFFGGDCETAINVLEAELKRAYPQATPRKELQHPDRPDLLSRGYRVDLNNGRVAFVEVVFPRSRAKGNDRGFWIKARGAAKSN